MKKALLALVVSAALVMPTLAAPGKAAGTEPETVGGFAVKLAVALGTPAVGPEAAAAKLKAAGVDLGADLNARLTEKEAARILKDLGVSVVAPTNPNSQVSASKGSALASTAGMSLSAGVGVATAELPEECLSSKNRGQCVKCCQLATHCGFQEYPDAEFACNVCAAFCKANQPPPPSPEEPM